MIDGLWLEALEREFGAARIERDVPLAPLTTFRIGGPADLLFRARTADELMRVLQLARARGIPHFVLGAGANILVDDLGYRGLIVRCEVGGIEFLDEVRVRAGAGVHTYRDLIDATVGHGLGGLHHYVGIPSTVGGAVWQNLHFLAPDRQRTCFIEEVIESCEILTEEGELRSVPREYFRFGYDYSILHDRADVVLSATFALEPQPLETLRDGIRRNLEWRDERHPDLWLYPCVGSIFRKIEGIGAGRLIDECGLKGRIEGGAQIFPRHANIIVNLGGATAADVRRLIDLAAAAVLERFGLELVPEITFVGPARAG